mmetsp:Transcript_75327/g.104625  ORF Transcript_75327/g.104625 Transcript_75327/m.104625 type:complete len:174 (-) Transcript_75327:74-595(-)
MKISGIFVLALVLAVASAIKIKQRTTWNLVGPWSNLVEGKKYWIQNVRYKDFISIDVFSKKLVRDWKGAPIKLQQVSGKSNQWYMNIDNSYWVKDVTSSDYALGWSYSTATNLRWKIHKPYDGNEYRWCIENMSSGRKLRTKGSPDILRMTSSCTDSKRTNRERRQWKFYNNI